MNATPGAQISIHDGITAAIETHELTKRYGDVQALARLSMRVERGEVFGFLGPNGAGKTTALRLLLGLSAPTSGHGTVLGAPLGDRAARGRLGYLPELFRYQPWMRAREVLELHCDLAGIPRSAFEPGAHVYLGHGAAGSAASMRPHVEGLMRRGIAATALQLPKRKAEATVDVYRDQVDGGQPLVIGGHSFGGRVASLLAARQPPFDDGRRIAGLVLFSYPLHRPGAPDLDARSAHFATVECPVLFLSGESDPFARIDLLRMAVERLADAQLITYPRLGHGLGPVLDDALDRVAAFVARLR